MAILDGVYTNLIYLRTGTTQELFLSCLVQINLVVSEKKIFFIEVLLIIYLISLIIKIKDDGCQVMEKFTLNYSKMS